MRDLCSIARMRVKTGSCFDPIVGKVMTGESLGLTGLQP